MPQPNSLELAQYLQKNHPGIKTKVILLLLKYFSSPD